MIRAVTIAAALGAILLVGYRAPARTLSIAAAGDELRLHCDEAGSSIEGRVVQVSSRPAGPSGQPGIHSVATLTNAVDLCGRTLSTDSIELWTPGGRLGREVRRVTGQVTLHEGDTVILSTLRVGGTFWISSRLGEPYLVSGDVLRTATGRLVDRDTLMRNRVVRP